MPVFYADGSRHMEAPYLTIAPHDPAVIDDQDCVGTMRLLVTDFQRQMREYVAKQMVNDHHAFRGLKERLDGGFEEMLVQLCDVDTLLVRNAERVG